MHRIKEKRKTFASNFTEVEVIETVRLKKQPFTQEPSFVHKVSECRTVNGLFCFFNDYQTLYLLDVFGGLQGEWNVNLPTPKRWNFHYNELESVLARLSLTEKALGRLCDMDTTDFKTDLLLAKYIAPS
jgi:hypothetical protein